MIGTEQDGMQDLIKRVEKLEQAVFGSGNTFTPKRKSPMEYLRGVKVSSEVESTVALAYYLEVYRNVKPLSKTEIEEIFRESKVPHPKNTSDTIAQNVRKGYLMLVDGSVTPKTYELTASGIDHVEKDLMTKDKG